jgi:hypothetical protein
VISLASITLDSTSRFDLTGDALDLSATTLASVTAIVSAGYHDTWQGPGLISSWAAADSTHLTTLGVIQNNQSGTALYSSAKLFENAAPNTADILVKYTYFGDTNLDGKLDGSDYSRIDNGYLTHATGWFNGDFNYDQIINGSDYTLIDNAYNTQGAQLTALTTTEIVSPASVPEPTAFALAGLASISLLGRTLRAPRRTT